MSNQEIQQILLELGFPEIAKEWQQAEESGPLQLVPIASLDCENGEKN